MSIAVCNECDVVIEGHQVVIDGEEFCPYCDEPSSNVSEDRGDR